MGYYTDFHLDIDFRPPLNDIENVPQELCQKVVDAIYRESGDYVRFDWDGAAHDSYKWYDCKDVMLLVSKQFPALLLTLWGDGEDSEDKWVSYFLDGKVQEEVASIIYPKFSETELR
jgi:hypothetical protein